jgi:hypothetical protein
VSTFLQGNGLSQEAAFQPSEKPYAFCGDQNYQAYSWDASVLDDNGKTIPSWEDESKDYTVREMYGIDIPNQNSNPFYSLKQKSYVFAEASTPCGSAIYDDGTLAQTMAFVARPFFPKTLPDFPALAKLNPSMTLCDGLLGDLPDNYVNTLADIDYPTAAAPINLDSTIPRGATLFHELTHLATTNVIDYWCAYYYTS